MVSSKLGRRSPKCCNDRYLELARSDIPIGDLPRDEVGASRVEGARQPRVGSKRVHEISASSSSSALSSSSSSTSTIAITIGDDCHDEVPESTDDKATKRQKVKKGITNANDGLEKREAAHMQNKKDSREKSKNSSTNSPYLLYCEEYRPAIKAQNPSVSSHELSALLGKAWTSLDASDKKRYKEMSESNKAQAEVSVGDDEGKDVNSVIV